jgi:hypothetical protein
MINENLNLMDLLPQKVKKICNNCEENTDHKLTQYFMLYPNTKYILCQLPTIDYHQHPYLTKIKNFNCDKFQTERITNEFNEPVNLKVKSIIIFDFKNHHYTIFKRHQKNWISIDSLKNTYNNETCDFIKDLTNVYCILFKKI